MHLSRAFVVALVAGWLLPSSLTADEPVTLQYKLEPGSSQLYQTSSNMQQKQTVAGQEISTSFTMREVTERSLRERTDDGDLEIASKNNRLYFEANIPQGGEFTYDSTKAERNTESELAEQLNKVFDRLSGATFTFTMTPRGELKTVEGFQKLLADILKENPGSAQFVGGGTDEAQRLALTERLLYLPAKPVEPGDTWEQTTSAELPNLGTMKSRRTFKYEGPDNVNGRPTARISISSEMTFQLNMEQMGAKVTGTLKTTRGEGTAQFDRAAGRLVSSKSTMDLAGELSVSVGDQVIPVQTEQTQTTTTELLDRLPE
jgi:hypothetical protein